FGHGDAFFFRLVGQHRTGNDVTDGVDASDIGAQMPVNLNAAALINLNARGLESKPLCIRLATGRDQHHVSVDRLSLTAFCRLEGNRSTLLGLFDCSYLGAELEGKALLAQQALELL